MSLDWGYPLYLIGIELGFASVVDEVADGQRRVSLVVFTDQARMERFMHEVGLEGMPRPIANDREFSYLLQGLRAPVTSVAFDSAPCGREVHARWIVEVQELLDKHLPWAASPWSYPLYVVAERDGFSCVEETADSKRPRRAMSLFTTSNAAQQYAQNARIEGSVQPVATPDDLRTLLQHLDSTVTAMAIDPTAAGVKRMAKRCVEIATVLEKYLPSSKPSTESKPS